MIVLMTVDAPYCNSILFIERKGTGQLQLRYRLANDMERELGRRRVATTLGSSLMLGQS